MLFSFSKNGRLGMINKHGDVVVEPLYLKLSHKTFEGYALGYRNALWAFIDENGKGRKFYNATGMAVFREGRAAIHQNGYVGFINKRFEMVIRPKYAGGIVAIFNEGLARVGTPVDWESRKFGFINKIGQEVIDLKYDYANDFHEGISVITTGDKQGAIDKEGRVIIEPIYDSLNDCHEGHLLFCLNEKWGVMDKTGQIIVEPFLIDYDEDGYYLQKNYSGGFLSIKKGDKYTFIDKNGLEMDKPWYDDVRPFHNGYAPVKRKEMWSFINKDFNSIAKYQFMDLSNFKQGLAAVEIDGKWGYINTEGEFVIQPIYEEAADFEHGLAGTTLNGQEGYINTNGEEVFRV